MQAIGHMSARLKSWRRSMQMRHWSSRICRKNRMKWPGSQNVCIPNVIWDKFSLIAFRSEANRDIALFQAKSSSIDVQHVASLQKNMRSVLNWDSEPWLSRTTRYASCIQQWQWKCFFIFSQFPIALCLGSRGVSSHRCWNGCGSWPGAKVSSWC